MSKNFEDGINFLKANPNASVKELTDFASQVSAKSEGAKVAYLYSGGIETDIAGNVIPASNNGIQASEFADTIAKQSNGQIAAISQTDAVKFVDSAEFAKALKNAVS